MVSGLSQMVLRSGALEIKMFPSWANYRKLQFVYMIGSAKELSY